MATEYRIVTVLDPAGVTAGAAKAKQDLRSVDTAADTTKKKLKEALAAPTGSAAPVAAETAKQIEKVDKAATSAATSTSNLGKTLSDVASAGTKAAASTSAQVNQSSAVTKANAGLSASYFKVLTNAKEIAAETFRLNDLQASATKLFADGTLSAERFARAQLVVAAGLENVRTSQAKLNSTATTSGGGWCLLVCSNLRPVCGRGRGAV